MKTVLKAIKASRASKVPGESEASKVPGASEASKISGADEAFEKGEHGDYVPAQVSFKGNPGECVVGTTSHESVVGLYDNQVKKKCRSDVISHAIRCLTTERHTSACVQRGHVRRVWQQLQESGESQAYFHPLVIESIEAEISQWEILHETKIQSRKPSDLNVCYLGGNNPINDLEVLVDSGVLPQNVWAVENDTKTFESAREAIRRSRFRNVRLFKGDILKFLKDYEGNFDIIYFDACGTLPSANQSTLKFIGYVFRYNKLTSPGALITNFSFPPKREPTECDEEAEQPSRILRESDKIRKLVTEYLKYRLDNTRMNKGSPERNAKRLGQRTDEENYGDYITYQVIDSAYLYIPALRMLSSTRSGQSSPLWDQMFKSKKNFHNFLKECRKFFQAVSESSPDSESSIGEKSCSFSETASPDSKFSVEEQSCSVSETASEVTDVNKLLGASAASESNAGRASSDEVFLTLKDASKASPLWKCGFALEEEMQNNDLCKTWVTEILPDWQSTSNLKTEKLPLLLLTHLLSHFDFFISTFTNENFQEKCIEPLYNALHSDHDDAVFPKFYNVVDLSNTRSLVAGLLYGQMAYPSFPVVDKMLRLCYTGNTEEGRLRRQMFTDVFIFDQCRYVYQQFPSIDCACFAITEPEQQMVFRMVVDGLRKHLEDICFKDVFPSCHVASIDPVPKGKISFPNSRPKIPKRKEVN